MSTALLEWDYSVIIHATYPLALVSPRRYVWAVPTVQTFPHLDDIIGMFIAGILWIMEVHKLEEGHETHSFKVR